jgi:hypothetical protein
MRLGPRAVLLVLASAVFLVLSQGRRARGERKRHDKRESGSKRHVRSP